MKSKQNYVKNTNEVKTKIRSFLYFVAHQTLIMTITLPGVSSLVIGGGGGGEERVEEEREEAEERVSFVNILIIISSIMNIITIIITKIII